MKNLRTIAIIVIVAGLAVFAYFLTNGTKTSNLADEALSDFAVKDTAAVDKLIITDTEGNKGVTLMRNGTEWEMESGACVQQHLVHTILETIKYIKVKGPVSEGAIENTNKSIAAHNKKLEIFQNGTLVKTWYIGSPTPDQYGTFMLLKDPEKGKSPEPFIMHLPNMYGNLESRFTANPLEYECTDVFIYDPANIAQVEVTIPDSAHLNFEIKALDQNLFDLTTNGKEVPTFDTVAIRDYLVGFRKVHFEGYNYGLTEEKIDSIRNTTPIYTIKVTDKEGESESIRLFNRRYTYEKAGLDGEILEIDQDRIWVELDDGRLVVGQFFVFGKLMRDVNFFIDPRSYF